MNLNPLRWFSNAPKPEPAQIPVFAAEWRPSDNFATRMGASIDTIVLHNTAGRLDPSMARLHDEAAQVSAHYVIDRDGRAYQLVKDDMCAWHAGNRAVNQRSIGIEIVAWKGAPGMEPKQEAALVTLIRLLIKRYGISTANIVPHRKVRATECPGYVWPTDAQLQAWVTKNFETKGTA